MSVHLISCFIRFLLEEGSAAHVSASHFLFYSVFIGGGQCRPCQCISFLVLFGFYWRRAVPPMSVHLISCFIRFLGGGQCRPCQCISFLVFIRFLLEEGSAAHVSASHFLFYSVFRRRVVPPMSVISFLVLFGF